MVKRRAGDLFGKYLDVAGAWRVWWGQEETIVGSGKNKPREKFFR